MKTDQPTADELSHLAQQCTSKEWTLLCQTSAFIDAAGQSMEAAAGVAEQFLGRKFSVENPKEKS
jgi:hypothetical protein